MLLSFIVGSFGTLIGTIVAWRLVPLAPSLGATDAWKIAAALCARHIGGAVNYVALVEATGASAAAVTAGLAADNLIVALYFLLLFYLARWANPTAPSQARSGDHAGYAKGAVEATASPQIQGNAGESVGEDVSTEEPIQIMDVAMSTSLAVVLCAVGAWLSASYLPFLGTIPVVTGLVLALATLVPGKLRRLRPAGSGLGSWLMQIFFAATGASGSIAKVFSTAPALFLFSALQISIHLAVVLVVGRALLRLPLRDLLLSSNANVGGPTTAAGMAAAKRWQELVVPSLLVGVFGYAIATFVSLGVGHVLLKPR